MGRTGRAGRKGTAITFITNEEAEYSPDLVRALTDAKQTVPEDLKAMAEDHKVKVAAGDARKRRSGYATAGYKFDAREASQDKKVP